MTDVRARNSRHTDATHTLGLGTQYSGMVQAVLLHWKAVPCTFTLLADCPLRWEAEPQPPPANGILRGRERVCSP